MGGRASASAEVAAEWLAGNPPAGPVLTVDDPGAIAVVLDRAGIGHTPWRREARYGGPATAWPPDGPFATAVVALPKGREAQQMALHAIGARLAPGGTCIVHGHNDAGIKSAGKVASDVFAAVETVDARRHCRVWACSSPGDGLRGALDDWRSESEVALPDGPLRWWTWPGLFAHGRLDAGTELLLSALPALPAGTRVLDWACGAGVIAKVLLRRNPGIAVDLLDIDALATHAARCNVPEAGVVWCSDAWSDVPGDRRWDRIVSNPPLHAGVRPDATALHALIDHAPGRLAPGGALWIVTQRNVALHGPLSEKFRDVRVAAVTEGFRVWVATA